MDAMEAIKTEARAAITEELRDAHLLAAEHTNTENTEQADWDAAVERIVARIESAADDMDPQPFAIGSAVEHVARASMYGPGIVTDRLEADGELHTVKVRWPDLRNVRGVYSPRELTQADR